MTVTSSLKFLDIFWDLAYCAPLLPSDRMDNGHAAIRDTERDVFVFVSEEILLYHGGLQSRELGQAPM